MGGDDEDEKSHNPSFHSPDRFQHARLVRIQIVRVPPAPKNLSPKTLKNNPEYLKQHPSQPDGILGVNNIPTINGFNFCCVVDDDAARWFAPKCYPKKTPTGALIDSETSFYISKYYSTSILTFQTPMMYFSVEEAEAAEKEDAEDEEIEKEEQNEEEGEETHEECEELVEEEAEEVVEHKEIEQNEGEQNQQENEVDTSERNAWEAKILKPLRESILQFFEPERFYMGATVATDDFDLENYVDDLYE
jgi:hypothetical protein